MLYTDSPPPPPPLGFLSRPPFAVQPLLAGRVSDRDAFEKFALVQCRRRAKGFVVAFQRQLFEPVRVYLDHFGLETDGGAIDLQNQVRCLAEGLAD